MTIGRLRREMSHSEYMQWLAYCAKHGPLSPERRFDRGPAIIAAMLSKDAKTADFMPWPAEFDHTPPDEASAVRRLIGG
jgi:hypothetical protein